MKIQLIAPDFKYVAMMNKTGVLSIYDVNDQHLVSTSIIQFTYFVLINRVKSLLLLKMSIICLSLILGPD